MIFNSKNQLKTSLIINFKINKTPAWKSTENQPGFYKPDYILPLISWIKTVIVILTKPIKKCYRGHSGLNWGPFDLQSKALPLSYTPCNNYRQFIKKKIKNSKKKLKRVKIEFEIQAIVQVCALRNAPSGRVWLT